MYYRDIIRYLIISYSITMCQVANHLLHKHNKYAPPDGHLNVNFQMDLVNIMEVNELSQTLTVMVYIEMKWIDSSLSWKPAEFSSIEKTWLPACKVWLPDVIVFNMVAHENLMEDTRAPVQLNFNGTVVYNYPSLYTVTCTMNIGRFPLDSQRCYIEVASWEYGVDKMTLLLNHQISLYHYKINKEWTLVEMKVINGNFTHDELTISRLKYSLKIKRKPLFYQVTLIAPSFVICFLSIIGLFTPFSTTGERQERYTLGVTAILTMAVLSLVVSQKVPHSSEEVPLLVAYFIFCIILLTVATTVTGIIMRIHRNGIQNAHKPPKWLAFLCKIHFNSSNDNTTKLITEKGKNLGESGTLLQETLKQSKSLKSFECRKHNDNSDAILEKLIDISESLNDIYNIMSLNRNNSRLWGHVAGRIDVIFMLLFISFLCIPTLWLF